MFKRLLKHQLKTTWKEFNIGYGAIVLLGLLLAISIRSEVNTFMIIMTILFVFAILALTILFLNFFIKLFYHTTYGKQAYLTFTLPISTHSLIISKIVSALLYMLGYAISIFLAILMFFLVLDASLVKEMVPLIGDIISALTINPGLVIVSFIYFIIGLLASLLQLQFIFALANSFTGPKKKVSIIILLLFAVGTILSIIEVFDPIDLYFGVDALEPSILKFRFLNEVNEDIFVPAFPVWSLILQLAQLFGFYFLTIYLIDKKIEIQ